MTSSHAGIALALAASLLAVPEPASADDAAGKATASEVPAAAQPPDRWAPFRAFLGAWQGTSSGAPGRGTVRREYRLVLRDRYVEVRSRSSYPPQEKNPKGEEHEEVGYVSFDRARKAYVLRQFHAEGFVNTYAAPASVRPEEPIVFTSEAIENIAPGWRARETYRFAGEELVETFELAEPGKDFTTYSETRLKRAR